jgi:hypothetical protein
MLLFCLSETSAQKQEKRLAALQKIIDINSDSCIDMECTPSEVLEVAKNNSFNLLPPKSRDRYEFSYKQFMDWRIKKEIKSSFSENVLIGELSETVNLII